MNLGSLAQLRDALKKVKREDRGWPKYLPGGRVRTSTAALVVAFILLSWLHQTYEPTSQPPAPASQVVPPGFVPDPEYTWVPRTQVRVPTTTAAPTATTTTTTTPTEPTETTTSPSEPTTTSSTTSPTSPTSPTSGTTGPAPATTTVIDPDGPGPLPPLTLPVFPPLAPQTPAPAAPPGPGPAPATPAPAQ